VTQVVTLGQEPSADGPSAGPAAFCFEARALASPLRLQVHGGTADAASTAWAAVEAEFAAVDRALPGTATTAT
jgi:hypothetical protein